MGPILELGCFVREQVVADRGKMTLLGGLRGTKLELKGALGGAQEAPRKPKSATTIIDGGSRGVILEPQGPPNNLSKLRYQYYRTGRIGGLQNFGSVTP